MPTRRVAPQLSTGAAPHRIVCCIDKMLGRWNELAVKDRRGIASTDTIGKRSTVVVTVSMMTRRNLIRFFDQGQIVAYIHLGREHGFAFPEVVPTNADMATNGARR